MSDVACARCGQIHVAGNTCHRSTGEPCGKAPVRGMTVCATHGGQAPQAKAARDRREAEEHLQAEIIRAATTGPLPLLEPGVTLLEAVAMLAQGVGYLRRQLAAKDTPGADELETFFRQVERLARIAKLADDARLGERRIRLEEDQGRLVVELLERVIRRLGADPMDPGVREIVREELIAIDGGQAA